MDGLVLKRNKGLAHRPTAEGFSTIELMVAMAILILILTAVVLVSFSNQSFSIGSQTGNEAMKLAQELLEEQQALARKDFNLVNSTLAPTQDDIYQKEVTVKLLPDLLTKEVKAIINWKNERQVDKTLELLTLISNFESPAGGNTCDSTPTGDWTNPEIENTGETNFAALIGDASGTYPITDIDVYKEKLYVTVGQTTTNGQSTLYIFDISDPSEPDLLGSVDNAPSVTSGLNAVRVSEDPASSPTKTYAYAGSNTLANYSTCDPVLDKSCAQVYIFNITNASSPTLSANLKLSTTPTITGQTRATSLSYKNGYVFTGLEATNGPEFNIVDVHNPQNIVGGSYVVSGSFETQVGINAINIKNNYAYLGLANNASEPQELRTLNISSLSNPYPGPSAPYYGFNAATGAGHGKSIYIVGDKLYLGKTTGADEDLHIIDNTDPATTLSDLGGSDLSTSVNGVIVRDYLSFILTNNNLRILRTDDESNITSWGSISLPTSGSATYEPSMDCEANRIYVSSNDAANKGYIYVIKPQ